MKVLFRTRCGCEREDILKDCPPEYLVPLRTQIGVFPKAIEGVEMSTKLPESRRFIRMYSRSPEFRFIYMESK